MVLQRTQHSGQLHSEFEFVMSRGVWLSAGRSKAMHIVSLNIISLYSTAREICWEKPLLIISEEDIESLRPLVFSPSFIIIIIINIFF